MLRKIMSKVGKPLVTDKLTAIRTRMSYPRVMVEVSADKPLKERVVLRGPLREEQVQEIHYEWWPWHCMECKKFGHKQGHCHGEVPRAKPPQKRTVQQWRPKVQGQAAVANTTAPTQSAISTKKEDDAGEWTITRRRKGKEPVQGITKYPTDQVQYVVLNVGPSTAIVSERVEVQTVVNPLPPMVN